MPKLEHIMKPEPRSLAGRRVLVVGLGRFGGGVGVTRWSASEGAIVTVTDQATREMLAESAAAVADLPIALHLGGHDEGDLDAADLVIINPAVNKSTSAFFQAVVRRGIPWTTEINLFCERCPAKVLGVTGSYGKSTTCAMLAEAMETCRRAGQASYTGVYLGGNIGRSLLNDLPNIRETDWVVLEMSNAQLEDLPRIHWAPDVAVITNLFPHHLDRYACFADYAGAKLNIIRHPDGCSKIVVGELHPVAEDMLGEIIADRRDRVIRVPAVESPIELRGSNRTPSASAGPSPEDRRIQDRSLALPVQIEALRVPGDHNQKNAACVLTVCRLLGLNERIVRDSLRNFRGLPHRLEFVRTLDGVDYYNDSKSTAPTATVIALEALVSSLHPDPREFESFSMPLSPSGGEGRVRGSCDNPSVDVESERRIIAIVGGQRKDVSLAECAICLARHCRVLIGMGESGPNFAEAVRQRGTGFPPVKIHVIAALPDAVRLAHAEAKPADVVLFSPGAPSFDQYTNFTERGRHFSDLVNAL